MDWDGGFLLWFKCLLERAGSKVLAEWKLDTRQSSNPFIFMSIENTSHMAQQQHCIHFIHTRKLIFCMFWLVNVMERKVLITSIVIEQMYTKTKTNSMSAFLYDYTSIHQCNVKAHYWSWEIIWIIVFSCIVW